MADKHLGAAVALGRNDEEGSDQQENASATDKPERDGAQTQDAAPEGTVGKQGSQSERGTDGEEQEAYEGELEIGVTAPIGNEYLHEENVEDGEQQGAECVS